MTPTGGGGLPSGSLTGFTLADQAEPGPRRAFTRFAFTLAEILITLGIIGIVAVLTMPTLVANYQKSVVSVRLKKFYTVWRQQNAMKIAEDLSENAGGCVIINAPNDPDAMYEYFNEFYVPYVKFTEVVKMQKGIRAGFPDGSGIYVIKASACPTSPNNCTCNAYLYFCPDYKDCKNFDETKLAADGKKTYFFWLYSSTFFAVGSFSSTREQLISSCRNGSMASCSNLIQLDNWEIKDDYPW